MKENSNIQGLALSFARYVVEKKSKEMESENRIVALFMPLSSEYADIVAAKITHYDKYSYLVFQSGKNQDEGFWPVEKSPLVYEWR